jgi:hypothetical protein
VADSKSRWTTLSVSPDECKKVKNQGMWQTQNPDGQRCPYPLMNAKKLKTRDVADSKSRRTTLFVSLMNVKRLEIRGRGRPKIQTDNVVRLLVEPSISSSYSITMFLRLYCKNFKRSQVARNYVGKPF